MTSTPYNFEQLQFENPKIQIITKFYLFTRYFVEGLRTLLDALSCQLLDVQVMF